MGLKADLIAAKALIDTPEKWAQDAGENGKCYCIVTAFACGLELGISGARYDGAIQAVCEAGGLSDSSDLIRFNDAPTTTHADIMALFDRAIAAAEA